MYVNKEYTKECVAQFINCPKRCLEDVMTVMTIFWGVFCFCFGCKRVMLHNGDNDDRNCLSLSLSICYLYLYMGTVGMINKSDHSNI